MRVSVIPGLALVLTALAGCGGAENSASLGPVPGVSTVTVTADPEAAQAVPDYSLYIREARSVGPLTAAFARRDLLNVANESCRAFDDGATLEALVDAASDPDDPEVGPYARALSALAALRVCPEHASKVTVQDAAPVDAAATGEPTGAPTPDPEPALPTTFGDGLYEVGRDVAPGRYRNEGPVAQGGPCVAYSSSDPAGTEIIASSNGAGPGILDLSGGEFVTATNCQTWQRD